MLRQDHRHAEIREEECQSPTGNSLSLSLSCLVEAADQARQCMTIFRVVIVARSIKICGHQAYGIETVLLA